jgi:hypothetical protein
MPRRKNTLRIQEKSDEETIITSQSGSSINSAASDGHRKRKNPSGSMTKQHPQSELGKDQLHDAVLHSEAPTPQSGTLITDIPILDLDEIGSRLQEYSTQIFEPLAIIGGLKLTRILRRKKDSLQSLLSDLESAAQSCFAARMINIEVPSTNYIRAAIHYFHSEWRNVVDHFNQQKNSFLAQPRSSWRWRL